MFKSRLKASILGSIIHHDVGWFDDILNNLPSQQSSVAYLSRGQRMSCSAQRYG